MTRSEHIRALLEEYAAQRARNEAEQQARYRSACAQRPEIARLREQSASMALGAMRSILNQASDAERARLAEEMKRRGRENNARIRALLREAGLPEDELEMRYRCPVCRDTGYVGEAPSRFCECFEARLRLRQYEDGTMADTELQNFDHFDEYLNPEEGGQRERANAARNLCQSFADTFPNTRFRNLVLMGEGGLGKTFLLNCVYERVIARGYSAVRITSFRMHEAMRRQHLSNDERYDGFSALIEVPLLLIDDLGSEPMMRNITVEYLFTLLNERQAARRHTVVATNLTPTQLKDRYGERMASRLLDRANSACVLLKGKDLRIL